MHSVKRVRNTTEQRERRKKEEESKIIEYNGLIEKAKELRKTNILNASSLKLTTAILDWNPDNYTVWNFRREILEDMFKNTSDDGNDNIRDTLTTKDLRFLEAILQKHPKIYWIWNHRRWCLFENPRPDWNRELKLVSMMLEMDNRNFHGWHYRRFVVANLEKATGQSLAEQEFEYTTKKINANFSNFSAWHNRTKLLPAVMVERKLSKEDRKSLVQSELEYIKQAIYTDPDDQSSWIYHRWLLSDDSIVNLTEEEKHKIFQQEIKVIQELYDVEPNSKWCALSLLFLKGQLKQGSRDALVEELEKLKKMDPLRKNRYDYLEQQSIF